MTKLRFGILSSAKIAVQQVIPAMQKGELTRVTSLASRSMEKAQKVCDELGIARPYGSYEEMLADPEIDAVYNPLPNHLHVPWSVKAMRAGKHVLCEKPLALSSKEARQLEEMQKVFPHLKVMEGFMYRHHPQWKKAKELVASGTIGRLKTVQSFFSYYNADASNIRNIAEIGGGGMMDIGCYCLSLSRYLFDRMPDRVCGLGEIHTEFKTDVLFSAMLDYGGGVSTFTCSTQIAPYQRVNIFGTEGRIEIMIPFNAPVDKETELFLYKNDSQKKYSFEVCDQYRLQGDSFAKAVLNDEDVYTPLEDGVQNMVLIEKCIESSRTGDWISIK